MPTGSDSSCLVDRLPVVVTSLEDGSVKLLGVPILPSGTGKASSKAVFEQLQSWKTDSLVVGMCFDTTASNTGNKAGAATLLESLLSRSLLWLSCRHHMLEILLSDVFGCCFGPSSGPEIPMFKRFRQNWNKLAHHTVAREQPLIPASDELKCFISNQIMQSHARDDYLELLHLAGLAVGLDIQVSYVD